MQHHAAVVFALSVATVVNAQELRLLTWNVQSGGNGRTVIANQLAQLQKEGNYHALVLQR